MIIKGFFIFFVIAILSRNSFADDDSSKYKLKAVYVTIRTGQTEEPDTKWTPEIDVNKDFMEKAKLSQSGRETIYNLGKSVKEYYGSKFENTGSSEIKLSSKGCAQTRCKASAALFKKGFENKEFKKEQEVSEEDMKGMNDEQAEIRRRFYTDCSPFMTEVINSVSDMWKKKQNDFKTTVDIIKDKLGENYTTPYNLWLTWESYYSMSKEEPDWLKENVKEDLKKISGKYFKAAFSTKKARKLSAGFLIGDIKADTSNFGEQNFEQIKVYAAPLPQMEATAAWFSGPNGYYKKNNKNGEKWKKWNYLEHGSLIALEIYESILERGDSDPQYGVKILIRNGNENLSDDSAVSIKGCDKEICPLTKVIEILKDYITNQDELDQYCKGTKTLE